MWLWDEHNFYLLHITSVISCSFFFKVFKKYFVKSLKIKQTKTKNKERKNSKKYVCCVLLKYQYCFVNKVFQFIKYLGSIHLFQNLCSQFLVGRLHFTMQLYWSCICIMYNEYLRIRGDTDAVLFVPDAHMCECLDITINLCLLCLIKCECFSVCSL